jgi:hypothetical protein
MPTVPLTRFIDFTVAQGAARVRAVAAAKKDYDPQTDFYKRIRSATVRQFEEGWDATKFRKVVHKISTPHKAEHFEECRAGLAKWARNKTISATQAPNKTWSAAGLDVQVNPELRMIVNGEKFVVKLYFSAPKLSKARRDHMLYLLEEAAPEGQTAAILDVRRSKLIPAPQTRRPLGPLLAAEAGAFASLY